MEVATRALLEELDRAGIAYDRVDTADPDDELGQRGRWTLHNIRLALRDVGGAAIACARRRVGAVYVPIAQEFPGLVRDLLFVALGIAARKPVIVHLHGGSLGDFYGAQRPAVKMLLRGVLGRATVGIVLTEGLRPALECVVAPSRIVVVQNGADLTEAPERAHDREEVHLLMFSSLFPSKGTLVFLEAFARVLEQRPFVRACVAGSWPSAEYEQEALALARELGVDGPVTFTGALHGERKAAVFADADIFCLPSFYPLEGQPIVVIEAMAAGLPVVATNWRGIPDTVVDRETGLLIDGPSPAALAEKLLFLVDAPDERRRLGEAGRARYERLFTQRAFGDRMVRVLEPFVVGDDAVPARSPAEVR